MHGVFMQMREHCGNPL